MRTAVRFSFSSLVYRAGDNFAIERQWIYELVVTWVQSPATAGQPGLEDKRTSLFLCFHWNILLFSFFKFFLFFFFDVDHFKRLCAICHNIASVLCFDFLAKRHVKS